MVGLSAGCFDHVMPYMYERKQFGTHIGDFQAMQHQFAQVIATAVLIVNACNLIISSLKTVYYIYCSAHVRCGVVYATHVFGLASNRLNSVVLT
jgi:alkylation response protein AidB-like acyl-CoA dehydrogenase